MSSNVSRGHHRHIIDMGSDTDQSDDEFDDGDDDTDDDNDRPRDRYHCRNNESQPFSTSPSVPEKHKHYIFPKSLFVSPYRRLLSASFIWTVIQCFVISELAVAFWALLFEVAGISSPRLEHLPSLQVVYIPIGFVIPLLMSTAYTEHKNVTDKGARFIRFITDLQCFVNRLNTFLEPRLRYRGHLLQQHRVRHEEYKNAHPLNTMPMRSNGSKPATDAFRIQRVPSDVAGGHTGQTTHGQGHGNAVPVDEIGVGQAPSKVSVGAADNAQFSETHARLFVNPSMAAASGVGIQRPVLPGLAALPSRILAPGKDDDRHSMGYPQSKQPEERDQRPFNMHAALLPKPWALVCVEKAMVSLAMMALTAGALMSVRDPASTRHLSAAPSNVSSTTPIVASRPLNRRPVMQRQGGGPRGGILDTFVASEREDRFGDVSRCKIDHGDVSVELDCDARVARRIIQDIYCPFAAPPTEIGILLRAPEFLKQEVGFAPYVSHGDTSFSPVALAYFGECASVLRDNVEEFVRQYSGNLYERSFSVFTAVTKTVLIIVLFLTPTLLWHDLRYYTFAAFPLVVFLCFSIAGTAHWVGDPFFGVPGANGYDFRESVTQIISQANKTCIMARDLYCGRSSPAFDERAIQRPSSHGQPSGGVERRPSSAQ